MASEINRIEVISELTASRKIYTNEVKKLTEPLYVSNVKNINKERNFSNQYTPAPPIGKL